MPLFRTLGITVVLTVLGAAAVGELLFDWRTPRSDYVAGRALGTNVSMSLVTFGEITKEMKEKYGPLVSVSLNTGSGQVRVEKDGQLLHEESMEQRITDVVGMFLVGKRGQAADMTFAFRLAPDQNLKEMSGGIASLIHNRFGKDLPARWQTLNDQDWTIRRCVNLADGLGYGDAAKLMRLRKGSACVVTWRRIQPQPPTMLVTVALADGDPWMRPFSRRLCRGIAEAALKLVDQGDKDRPTFAACVLIDRPGRKGATQVLVDHVYSVGPGLQLASMD